MKASSQSASEFVSEEFEELALKQQWIKKCNMVWGQHISEISSKATKTLGFLRRNLAFATTSTKEVAYKTLVRPKLEYAAPFWSPYSKPQINQVEKVQRTAAHWTCRRWRNTGALKNFFCGLFHSGIVFLLRWSIPRPLRSLGHS